jgi:iron complex transport system substrate-binding protein
VGPQRIVCLTEETTEWLYLLGEDARIVGISGYTVRPPAGTCRKSRASASFLDGKIDKIVALATRTGDRPSRTCRRRLADKLIRAGLNVLDQQPAQRGPRSLAPCGWWPAWWVRRPAPKPGSTDCEQRHHARIAAQASAAWPRRPRVYFEEWDDAHDQRHPVGVAAGGRGRWRRRVS